MNGVGQFSAAALIDGVAGLMSAFVDDETHSAVLKHLRHEWEAFKAPVAIKRRKYLFFASDLNEVTRTKSSQSIPP